MDAILSQYRTEVLRWNRQINLVGRNDPAATVDRLISHCQAALAALTGPTHGLGDLAGDLLYCDIGAGAGFPGIVWHAGLTAAGHRPRTVLWEPRGKRAWFLERVARQLGMEGLSVVSARWGAAPLPAASGAHHTQAPDILLSLKALRMPETEVLAGIAGMLHRPGPTGQAHGTRRVVLVRFLPPRDASLAADEAAGAPGETAGRGAPVAGLPRGWRCVVRRIQTFAVANAESALLIAIFRAQEGAV